MNELLFEKLKYDVERIQIATKEEIEEAKKRKEKEEEEKREVVYYYSGLKQKQVEMTIELWRSIVGEKIKEKESEIFSGLPHLEIELKKGGVYEKFLLPKKRWLFLYGETGTGKTATMALFAKKYIRIGKSTMWLTANEIQTATFNYDDTHKNINELKNVFCLCIDEIGRENLTENFYRILSDILIIREADRKPTLFTSNLKLEDFIGKFDAAMQRRFSENAIFIEF